MEGYAVLMCCFAGLLLLYAAVLAITKDVTMIPYVRKAKIKNGKKHAELVAKAVALAALAPLISALVAWQTNNGILSLAALIGGFILFLWLGTRLTKE